MTTKKPEASKSKKPPKTTVRVGKFAIIGLVLSIFNFVIYTLLARFIFSNNELLWICSVISYSLATILAYILHSRITWKERPVSTRGIVMFFVWNSITAFIISPFFTWLFTFLTPLYQFAFSISEAIHLPFDYEFIESTGVFVLTNIITMILNYIFYDKLVFGDSNKKPSKSTPKEQND